VGSEFGFPGAAVPHDHVPPQYRPGDDALPVENIPSGIFGLNRQALVVGIETRTAGDGPAFENAVELELRSK